ncbi:MAG: DUF1573 domain-containing protein [Crocinitomicaceae bacterium]|nr:DUF1573 domain-containing protein [Crocinitomicaceae bacterium]
MIRGAVFIGILFLAGWANAQILVDNPSKDLGDIYENRGKVTAKFELKNPYKEDTIRIYDVKTSCGCTVILSQDTLIMPMSSTELKFSYDPQGRSGLFTKSIEVISRIGVYDQHRLFLKISGNVVSENSLVREVNAELIEYLVAPINYYAITPYDTSYLDFNFFISFVNDLSYEIDFYQFTTVGFEIGVKDRKDIEQLEQLIKYTQKKLYREFRLRGYDPNTVFFDDPVFKEVELPIWSKASVKVYSVNFGSDLVDQSIIKITDDDVVQNDNLMLNYDRFSRPTIDEILAEINFPGLEGKLFMNGELNLKGVIMSPKRMSQHEREKLAEKLEKSIFKQLKKSTGVSKKELVVDIDSLIVHPKDKFRFMLWDKADEEEQQKFTYEVKPDNITPPFLPTYKQSTVLSTGIDDQSEEFQYFWKNLILNHKSGKKITLLIESSKSKIPRKGEDDLIMLARRDGNKVKDILQEKFRKETGREMDVTVEAYVHGPEYDWRNKPYTDYAQYEYVNIIPLVHHKGGDNPHSANPYMVKFDYFFNGIDTSSWVFNKLAKYIAAEVEQNGYIHLIMESSISQIPIEKRKANIYLAYERALESQFRIKDFMKKGLVDPNRIIFSEERFLVQGPKYDGTIPIIKFRKFQYLKVIPEKHLTQ